MSTPQSSAVQTTQRSVTSKANTQICYACLVSHLHAFKMTIHSTIPKQTPKREFFPSPRFWLIGLNQINFCPVLSQIRMLGQLWLAANHGQLYFFADNYEKEMLQKHSAERREVWPKGMRAYSMPRCTDETERRQG